MSNTKQSQIVESRKRRRNKSLDQSSIEKLTKKSKHNSNEIILSNLTQTNPIVLATSGLNHQQRVCVFAFFSFLVLENYSLETS